MGGVDMEKRQCHCRLALLLLLVLLFCRLNRAQTPVSTSVPPPPRRTRVSLISSDVNPRAPSLPPPPQPPLLDRACARFAETHRMHLSPLVCIHAAHDCRQTETVKERERERECSSGTLGIHYSLALTKGYPIVASFQPLAARASAWIFRFLSLFSGLFSSRATLPLLHFETKIPKLGSRGFAAIIALSMTRLCVVTTIRSVQLGCTAFAWLPNRK